MDAAPVITVPGAQADVLGAPLALPGISVADADATVARQTLTVTVSDTHGLLSATATGGGAVAGLLTTKLTITGTLAQVNADLATLIFVTALSGPDDVKVAATDSAGGVGTPQSIAIGVSPTAPIINPGAVAFSQAIARLVGPRMDGAIADGRGAFGGGTPTLLVARA